MKWLSTEEEEYLRHKLPVLIKSSLSESFSETASSIAGEIGNRVLARLHQINVGAAQRNISDARKLQSDVLMHHYANHLGYKSAHLAAIINDYEKEKPRAPSPILFTYDKTGKPSQINNPNFGLEKREYDNKKAQYDERQKVLRQIKGLQRSNPVLGTLARQFSREERAGRASMELADPMVSRTPRQELVGPPGTIGPKLPPRPRNVRVSDLLLMRADALRRRRKIRSKLP